MHKREKIFKIEVDREYPHAIAITNLVSSSFRLYCSDWLVLLNKTDIPFITSDNPAILYHKEDFGPAASTFVPLTPSLGILISPNPSKNIPSIEELDSFRHENDRIAYIKEKYVTIFNDLIVKSAEKIVLSSDNLDWLWKMVASNKSWRVENITNHIPCENGSLIIHKQMAIDTDKA